jgi:hypothetical protein
MEAPIEHWSYSSMTLFLRNRLAFKKKYILKIYDDLYGPAAIVGQAAHKALEAFYNGSPVPAAIESGIAHLNKTPDTGINYGKTGSREKILQDYNQAINHYFAEAPEFNEILAVEKSIVQFITGHNGEQFAIPAKSFSDLIVRNENGKIDIVDHKFVSSYSDGEKDKGIYVIQALFNYHTVLAEYGEKPERMIFNECKIAKNSDGSPQLQPYVIEFEQQPEYFALFYNLYNDCTREICKPDIQFLPNFQDAFDGENTFELYKSQIITVDNPIAVQHKTQHTEYVEKKFVQSLPDKEENKFLTEEEKIRLKLLEFGIPVEMQETFTGASITQYTLKPSRGIKMSQFEKHDKDLALVLKAKSIRIQAPIMGTDLVGIEVPNPERTVIKLPDEIEQIVEVPGTLTIPIGVNVYGKTITKDLADMPHLLIAGATGAGKSVMMNVVIRSLTEQNSPSSLQLVLIDPKRVELSQFKNLPHLLAPVIFDDKKAATTLNWLVEEMEVRYHKLEQGGYRTINEYNADQAKKMPKIVVVIDEFADLILQSETGESEQAVVRLAQKARAIGIHIVLGTQRPSVDVVTGLIKANFPTRIAFMTSSRMDSQVILDQAGAEELVGKGDMLFLDPTVRGLQRLQGFYA